MIPSGSLFIITYFLNFLFIKFSILTDIQQNFKSFSLISIEKDGHKETDVMNDLLIIDWVTAVPESTVHFLEKICNMILQAKVTLSAN